MPSSPTTILFLLKQGSGPSQLFSVSCFHIKKKPFPGTAKAMDGMQKCQAEKPQHEQTRWAEKGQKNTVEMSPGKSLKKKSEAAMGIS